MVDGFARVFGHVSLNCSRSARSVLTPVRSIVLCYSLVVWDGPMVVGKLVFIYADCASRSALMAGFRGVGLFVASSSYFKGLRAVLSTPGVTGVHFGS